ncbi:amino acid ABC transporter substrate-binding protein [Corticibacterium sp. UT-5YL-CI-8]|nr:amino acid ABC transporter substrate-binding protein [Tianweitania sp. UT-5YL-CI-8]
MRALIVAAACLLSSFGVQATELQRIAESGVIRAGTRADAVPFAFRGADGTPQGFSVDLLEEIRAATEARLGKPVRLELSIVTPSNRLQLVEAGELDIVCEITTPTWQREKTIDFSIPFFRDGTRILAYRETLRKTPDIKDMVVGIAEGTTTAAILEEAMPGIVTKPYPTMDDAFAALNRGEIQGVSNIGIILLGLARKLEPTRSVVLLPRTEPLSNEAMACILPQNDSEWRDFVNQTIVGLTSGLADYRGRYMEIYNKWFGRDGMMVYPLDRSTRDYLLQTNVWSR